MHFQKLYSISDILTAFSILLWYIVKYEQPNGFGFPQICEMPTVHEMSRGLSLASATRWITVYTPGQTRPDLPALSTADGGCAEHFHSQHEIRPHRHRQRKARHSSFFLIWIGKRAVRVLVFYTSPSYLRVLLQHWVALDHTCQGRFIE